MWAGWYVDGPQVYILTVLSSVGLNGSIFCVSVLYMLSKIVSPPKPLLSLLVLFVLEYFLLLPHVAALGFGN